MKLARSTLALALLVACGDADGPASAPADASAPDATPDASADRGVPDAGSPDGTGDGAADAALDGPPPLPPTPLPLGPSDVTQLGSGEGLDIAAVSWVDGAGTGVDGAGTGVDGAGAVHLLYEHFDVDFTAGELRLASAGDGGVSFGAATKLELGPTAIHASPTLLPLAGGERYLYFIRATAAQGAAELCRAPVLDGAAVGSVTVVDSAPSLGLLSWPKLYRLDDGRVALVYRDGLSRPAIALGGDDGLSFGPPGVVHPDGAAMPALGIFGDGSLAYSYQAPGATESMISWVRRSGDGKSWSAPQRVTQSSPNVHDTTLVRRLDGGLDLYYILVPPAAPTGFVLHRRALRADGQLGDEQQLTVAAHGEPSKPGAYRLPDGHLLVTYAQIATRDPLNGWPTQQLLFVTRLAGDAPAP